MMTEAEYIAATNLTKYRIAMDVMRSVLEMNPKNEHVQRQIMRHIADRIEALEKPGRRRSLKEAPPLESIGYAIPPAPD